MSTRNHLHCGDLLDRHRTCCRPASAVTPVNATQVATCVSAAVTADDHHRQLVAGRVVVLAVGGLRPYAVRARHLDLRAPRVAAERDRRVERRSASPGHRQSRASCLRRRRRCRRHRPTIAAPRTRRSPAPTAAARRPRRPRPLTRVTAAVATAPSSAATSAPRAASARRVPAVSFVRSPRRRRRSSLATATPGMPLISATACRHGLHVPHVRLELAAFGRRQRAEDVRGVPRHVACRRPISLPPRGISHRVVLIASPPFPAS